MAKKVVAAFHHRATLKQTNKPFKGSKGKTTGKAGKQQIGKPVPTDEGAKAKRLNAANQRKELKAGHIKAEIAKEKNLKIPRLVAVVPFHPSVDTNVFKSAVLRFLLECAVHEGKIDPKDAENVFQVQSELGTGRHIISAALPSWAGKRRARIQFSFCHVPDEATLQALTAAKRHEVICAILDICKASDIVLGLFGKATISSLAFSDFGYQLKSLIAYQGLPWTIGAACPWVEDDIGMAEGDRQKSKAANLDIVRRCYQTEFGKDSGPLFNLVNCIPQMAGGDLGTMTTKEKSEMVHFLRHLATTAIKPLAWRESERGYLVSEQVVLSEDQKILSVFGHTRGLGFTCHYPVHITGLGDFPAIKISGEKSSEPGVYVPIQTMDETEVFEAVWKKLPPPRPADEDVVEELPTKTAYAESTEMGESAVAESAEMEDFEELSSGDEDWNTVDEEDDTSSQKAVGNIEYRSRNEMEFDDEVDTPNDIPARERFRKYRGLKSLINSAWEHRSADVPSYYSQIFNLKPYVSSMKEVRTMYQESLLDAAKASEAGLSSFVRLDLMVDPKILDAVNIRCSAEQLGRCPLIVSTMLPIERKISVQHFAIQRFATVGTNPIPSKSLYEMQCGFRRMDVRPIFSKSLNKSLSTIPVEARDPSLQKLLYTRYLHTKERQVYTASVIAPMLNPKTPVLMWLKELDPKIKAEVEEKCQIDNLELIPEFSPVAHGSFVTTDPDRVIVKRIFLTGYPHKIKKKSCSIQRMFFNRSDVEYYAPVPINTASGKQGKIKEPIGTHGDMKCVFNDSLHHGDTIRLPLYKRIVPPFFVADLEV